jgi:putative salt-induced outer membrane protein YdiY
MMFSKLCTWASDENVNSSRSPPGMGDLCDNLCGSKEDAAVVEITLFSIPVLPRRAGLIVLLLLVACPLFGKRKDDVVVMKNGDKFTGEIKDLQRGELIFSSYYMKDDVYLDWNEVETLRSKDPFIVALSNGERVAGFISEEVNPGDGGKTFKIIDTGVAIEVKPSEVIAIGQREGSIWNQLTGSVNYGFSFASGNSATSSSLGGDVAFRNTKNSVTVATTSQFNSQTNAENTNRFTFDSLYIRMVTNKWLAAGLFSLLKSNQQNLNVRSTYGGAFGRRLVQTDRTALVALGGAVYTHESYVPQSGTEPVRNNVESLVGLTFSTFRFKTLNVNSQALLFPSLSDPGRVRLSSQSNLRIELIRNFYWNFQLYENYDTRPPIAAPKNDLGITTSVGWTF